MNYIYTLSIDGIVFYVGRTINPVLRYKQHYSDCISCCYKILRYCSTINKACKMELIYRIKDDALADAVERELIHRYNQNFYLMNLLNYKGFYDTPVSKYSRNEFNDHINLTMPSIKDKDLNRAIFKQEIENIKQQILNYGQE